MRCHQDVNGILASAVREGRLVEVRQLMKYSRHLSQECVLLKTALNYGHLAVAKLLLTMGCKVNSTGDGTDLYSRTPLHLAVSKGDVELIEMLLERDANVNAKDVLGYTPLRIVIQNKADKHTLIAELLLKYGADVNSKAEDQKSVFDVAVQMGNLPIITHILNYATDVNSMCTKQDAPLHRAVSYGQGKVVTFLLSRGAFVDIKGEDEITPLHIAAQKGAVEIAEELLSHGACINSLTLTKRYTPLHFAIKAKKDEIIKLFLNKGADINAITKDGKTALLFAIENRTLSIIKDILKFGPDINNQSNRNSLRTASTVHRCFSYNIVEALLEYGFTVGPEDAKYPEFLHNAAGNGFENIVENLLKNGADVNTLYGVEGFTPLHRAVNHFQKQIAQLLIAHGADINTKDKSGKTPLFYAITNGNITITNLLLTSGVDVKNDIGVCTAAIETKRLEIIEALLQHDFNINTSDEKGRTALHIVASNLRDFKSNINEIPSFQECNFEDYIEHYNEESDESIDEIPCYKLCNFEDSSNEGSEESIDENQFYVDLAELLLSKGANVNAKNKNSESTLHIAAGKENTEMCRILLEKGADIHTMRNDGYTALHIATEMGHEKAVQLLLKYGAKVDLRNKDLSALHLAAFEGYLNVVDTLLKFGADIDLRDEYGRTALHIASRRGHFNIVETLLQYGADINITSEDKKTALDHTNDGISDVDTDEYDPNDDCPYQVTAQTLNDHLDKMRAAKLYVSAHNLLGMSDDDSYFRRSCVKEITIMKSMKLKNGDITYYEILANNSNSVARYMRNANIVKVLQSCEYRSLFPIYSSMIACSFRNGVERKKLLEKVSEIIHSCLHNLFDLPQDCVENILGYLTNKDLRDLINFGQSSNINNTDTAMNDAN